MEDSAWACDSLPEDDGTSSSISSGSFSSFSSGTTARATIKLGMLAKVLQFYRDDNYHDW